jgi:hypothetical protein
VYQRHSWADEKRDALASWAARVEALVAGRDPTPNVIELAAHR